MRRARRSPRDSAPPLRARSATGVAPQQLAQHARRDADQVAAPAAVDADAVELEDRRLDVDRHRLPGRERRRAADLVAARPLGRLGRARLDALGADRARQVLGADLAVAVHQDDQRLALLVLHDERLDDRVLVDAELARRLGRAAVLEVVVDVLAEGDAGAAQRPASPGSR